jgi:hypothetical protein
MPDKFRNKRKLEKQKAAHKHSDHTDGGMGGEYPEKDHTAHGGMGGEYPEGHSDDR